LRKEKGGKPGRGKGIDFHFLLPNAGGGGGKKRGEGGGPATIVLEVGKVGVGVVLKSFQKKKERRGASPSGVAGVKGGELKRCREEVSAKIRPRVSARKKREREGGRFRP